MMKKVKTGLFIGRFQPFHNGHFKTIDYILRETDCERLIIGIGSSQYAYRKENPFTYEERVAMISKALPYDVINVFTAVKAVPDIHCYSLWAEHVKHCVPGFDVVYSSCPDTIRFFEKIGVPTEEVPIQLDNLRATHVRELLANRDRAWHDLVPSQVMTVIWGCNGEERCHYLGMPEQFVPEEYQDRCVDVDIVKGG